MHWQRQWWWVTWSHNKNVSSCRCHKSDWANPNNSCTKVFSWRMSGPLWYSQTLQWPGKRWRPCCWSIVSVIFSSVLLPAARKMLWLGLGPKWRGLVSNWWATGEANYRWIAEGYGLKLTCCLSRWSKPWWCRSLNGKGALLFCSGRSTRCLSRGAYWRATDASRSSPFLPANWNHSLLWLKR